MNEGKHEKGELPELKLWLYVVFVMLGKNDLFYVYSIMKVILEKYCLFDNDQDNEEKEGLKEKLVELTDMKLNVHIPITSLSSLSLSFSNNTLMKRQENMIILIEDETIENCIFNVEMKTVYF